LQRIGAARDAVAIVRGQTIEELPADLYIPPDALEVFLEAFQGPLDLLLYLIRRQNLDILSIEVAEITEQYLHYIDLMQALKLDLAGEYLLMAAMLAEIKSRMLLPRPEGGEDDEEDPRAELVRRLREYERVKQAAEALDAIPRLERDLHAAAAAKPKLVDQRPPPQVDLKEMVVALAEVLRRVDLNQHHAVELEGLSVRERMSEVLARLGEADGFVPFSALFDPAEGRRGVVVTFLAILELAREALLELAQNEPYAPIYARALAGDVGGAADGPGAKAP
jgi:segregation and condensation protein A